MNRNIRASDRWFESGKKKVSCHLYFVLYVHVWEKNEYMLKKKKNMHRSFTTRDHAKGEDFSRCYYTTLCHGSNVQDAPPLSQGIMG